MYQPDLYSQNNDLQRRDIYKVLRNSMKLIKWSGFGTDMVVDLGCGSGDVTKDVILVNAPNIKGIVGVDISPEMLKFAQENYAHEMIKYRQLDLATKDLGPEFMNQFDHAFSFHVFHWIKDQRCLFDNIYKILKPGGDLLGSFVVRSDLMLIYEKQSTMPNWSEYRQNINDICPYQYCENPQKAIEDILNHSGFSHMVKLESREFIFPSREHFKRSMKAIHPFIKNVPEELHDDYMNDFADIAEGLNFSSNHNRQNQIGFRNRYIIAVVYLRKPDF